MSLLSNIFAKQIKETTKTDDKPTRLAYVTSVSGGNVYVRFYGETDASQKPQKRVSSYSPTVGDKVMLQKIGNSYVITGKVV